MCAAVGAPPPLRPFGLRLHRDGRFSHDGQAIRNAKLRALFERSVRFLPEEGVYVVRVGQFRGQVEVEEAGFFVRSVDPPSGTLRLSDGTDEALELSSLRTSDHDPDVLLCTVKRDLVPEGLAARFTPTAQAELLLGVEAGPGGLEIEWGGRREPFPAL